MKSLKEFNEECHISSVEMSNSLGGLSRKTRVVWKSKNIDGRTIDKCVDND